jgi:hypothetical protein
MKPSDFKKIIKEAVKEAIQEELKDILLEAVRQPKTIIRESTTPSYTTSPAYPIETGAPSYTTSPAYSIETGGISTSGITGTSNALSSRQAIMGMLDEMKTGNAKFTTNNLQYAPPPVSTIGEGSKLPDGEVGLDQIIGLMK